MLVLVSAPIDRVRIGLGLFDRLPLGQVTEAERVVRQAVAEQLGDLCQRILDGDAGTAATTRVLIDSSDGEQRWSTVGSSTNIIEASLEAYLAGLEKLIGHEPAPSDAKKETLV